MRTTVTQINAPWSIRNDDNPHDSKIAEIVQKLARKNEGGLYRRQKLKTVRLINNANLVRRLDKLRPFTLEK